MKKIVYNSRCGFALSKKAIDFMISVLGNKTAIKELETAKNSTKFALFCLQNKNPEEFLKFYKYGEFFNRKRTDPDLVSAVETLGSKADYYKIDSPSSDLNGSVLRPFSELKIFIVPAYSKYRVLKGSNYAGERVICLNEEPVFLEHSRD